MRGFLIFLMVVALIFVGWYMSDDLKDYGFWDIVEVEMHLLIWSLCFIFAFTGDEGPLSWFGDSRFSEKLKAILFLPVCAAICYYSARYGGDFLNRCMEALLKWKPLDLKGEFTMLPGVMGEYHESLYRLGLAFSPMIWAVTSRVSKSFPGWLLAAIFSILLGSLAGMMTYIIAFLLAIVVLVLAVLGFAAGNGERVREFKDGRWQWVWK